MPPSGLDTSQSTIGGPTDETRGDPGDDMASELANLAGDLRLLESEAARTALSTLERLAAGAEMAPEAGLVSEIPSAGQPAPEPSPQPSSPQPASPRPAVPQPARAGETGDQNLSDLRQLLNHPRFNE